MPRRRLLRTALLLLLLGGAGVAVGAWYFFGGSPPGTASIDNAASAVPTTPTNGSSATTDPLTIDGTWSIDGSIGSFSDFSSSWAGFRVDEVLDNIGNSTAIGRTPGVTGTLTLSDQTLSATEITVDLTSITSDRPRRDGPIQQTLETFQFPTATFSMTKPIELASAPAEGATYSVTATGDLTIHGVTRSVDFDLDARLVNGVIVVVGQTPFNFSDFGMSPPRAPAVLSVDDHGLIELQLFFRKS